MALHGPSGLRSPRRLSHVTATQAPFLMAFLKVE